jgi:hypothetical protein
MVHNGILLLSLLLKPGYFVQIFPENINMSVASIDFSLLILKDYRLNNTMFRGNMSHMRVAINHKFFCCCLS